MTVTRYDPSNLWYWFEGGPAIPVSEMLGYTAMTASHPSWEQLERHESLLTAAIVRYEDLVERGEAALPAHMKIRDQPGQPNAIHLALATAYRRIRELMGMVEEHKRALKANRVPRMVRMFGDPLG